MDILPNDMRPILFLLLTVASCAKAESADQMLTMCRTIADDAKALDNSRVQFANEDMETGIYWGAFMALQRVSRYVGSSGRPILPIGCAPSTTTRKQLVSIFVEFARRHPERLHEDFVNVAMEAIRTAFPCSE